MTLFLYAYFSQGTSIPEHIKCHWVLASNLWPVRALWSSIIDVCVSLRQGKMPHLQQAWFHTHTRIDFVNWAHCAKLKSSRRVTFGLLALALSSSLPDFQFWKITVIQFSKLAWKRACENTVQENHLYRLCGEKENSCEKLSKTLC